MKRVLNTLAAAAGASLVRSVAFERFVVLLEQVLPPRRDRLTVLTYHRVDEPEASPLLYPGLVSATPTEFAAQMRHVASYHRPISLAELLAVRRGEAELPLRSVLVTFDDAYRDFGEHAWPALREAGVPVTIFVATGFPDRPERAFWWDRVWAALGTAAGGDAERLARYRRLRAELKTLPQDALEAEVDRLTAELEGPAPPPAVLGWDALRRLAREGVELAPHTRTHPLLDRIPSERAREELVGSREDLAREIGEAPPALAYPSGNHDDAVVALAAEVGFELAFTTDRGANDLRRGDWLRLRRINVGRRLGHGAFRAQLLGRWPPRTDGTSIGPAFRSARQAVKLRPCPGSCGKSGRPGSGGK